MKILGNIAKALGACLVAAVGTGASSLRATDLQDFSHDAVLIADSEGGATGSRQRIISKEAKSRSRTKVDFEKADISGDRRTPVGSLIEQRKADKDYDFVKLRLRWHPEMIQSTSSLNSVAK